MKAQSYSSVEMSGGGSSEVDPLLRSQSNTQNPQQKPKTSVTKRSRQLGRVAEIQKEKSVFKSIFHYGQNRTRAAPTTLSDNVVDEEQDEPPNRQASRRNHSFLYSMLNPHSHSKQAMLFKRFMAAVILMDLVLFILSTDESITVPYDAEALVSWIFLIEYVARLFCVTESRLYCQHPLWGRLAYAVTWPAVVDLLATAPYFLERVSGWELPTLTYLRFFRLVRILKTEGYVRAMDSVYRVVYYNGEILYVACLLCMYLVLITAVLLYYFRPPKIDDNSQFRSILSCMYLSALILCGQGGPDEDDLPWYTRGLVLLTAVFSIPMFAIPASMLTWGFEIEAERMAKHSRRKAVQKRERELRESSGTASSFQQGDGEFYGGSSSSSSFFSSDGNTTDEEYFALIAGEDDGEDGEDDDSWVNEVRQKFKSADENEDGNLTLKEFLELSSKNRWESSGKSREFEQRLSKLEQTVAANTSKLDRILTILEKR